MPLIPQSIVDQLNRIPLTQVMEHHGYTISHRTENEAFYRCPFHNEKDASFKVDLHASARKGRGGASLPGFQCFGCGIKGYGALMLQAALMRKQLGKDFRQIAQELASIVGSGEIDLADPTVDALAKLGNMVIEGEHRNGFFHRAQVVSPQDEFSFVAKKDFSHNDLRAIGCQVQQVFRPNWENEGRLDAVYLPATPTNTTPINTPTISPIDTIESIDTTPPIDTIATIDTIPHIQPTPIYKYSFGCDFYSSDCRGNNFDPTLLTKRFNLYAVSEFTTEKRFKADKQEYESHRVVSTDTYPIFVFRYEDAQGWWCRKYEPYFKTTEKSPRNYKFTWWYQGGKRRDEEISKYMYGDVDVMRALAGKPVETTDKAHPTMDVVVREGGNRITKAKFKRLVICSGPRDAINVYFHSDAHVCFPHSETVDIAPSMIYKLRDIAQEIFILYDIDETGRKRANRLAMRFLDLKVIYLPRNLSEIESPRTGKPCKDAEEYFNYYHVKLKGIRQFFGADINDHFANMLINAKPMMFWKQHNTVRNKNKEDEYIEPKFTLRIDNMNQFLSASGMCTYDMGAKGMYANIGEDKVVDIMDEKQAFLCAKRILKDYLANNRYYNNEGLSDTISDTRKLSLGTLQEIGELNLDFRSWGEDFDYLFFSNDAVRVTKDGAQCIPYSKIPFHTNREAILEGADFTLLDMKELFEIVPNDELSKMEVEYKVRQREASTAEGKKQIQEEWNSYKRLWQFKLILKKPINEMPPIIQFIYDTGRVWWREEEAGLGLTPEKRQFHDMHFINKFIGLGYMLSRYRTDRRQQMVTLTDYSQSTSGNASGRSGKTMFMHLLGLVRKGLDDLPGKQFQTDPAKFAQNFSGFTQTVHSYVSIDDLRTDLKDDTFYNLVRQLPVKNLYHDTFRIPVEESPKIMITTNQSLNVTSTSTYGRMWPMYACDYYHGETYEGDEQLKSPETKFGYDIIKGLNEEERNINRNLMVYALQCYFQFLATGEKGVIHPPVDNEAKLKMLSNSCKLTMFADWFSWYFLSGNPWRFERPIHLPELAISYMEYRDSLKDKKEPVTKKTVDTLLNTMKGEIQRFCNSLNILINPDIVYPGEYDRSRGVIRKLTWVSQFDENGKLIEPRQRIRTAGKCWYFYRKGDEPKSAEQILDAPSKDMEFSYEE